MVLHGRKRMERSGEIEHDSVGRNDALCGSPWGSSSAPRRAAPETIMTKLEGVVVCYGVVEVPLGLVRIVGERNIVGIDIIGCAWYVVCCQLGQNELFCASGDEHGLKDMLKKQPVRRPWLLTQFLARSERQCVIRFPSADRR